MSSSDQIRYVKDTKEVFKNEAKYSGTIVQNSQNQKVVIIFNVNISWKILRETEELLQILKNIETIFFLSVSVNPFLLKD